MLSNRASIPMPESKTFESKAQWNKSDLTKINRLAGIYFYNKLKSLSPDSPVKKYLASRGIDDKLIHEFRLGVADEGWNGLSDYLQQNKVPLSFAEHLGLVKPKKSSKGYFDIFRNRIMFPIFSATNEVIGFGGRIIDMGQPKYLNSPETSLFSKRKVFYGINLSGPYIKQMDQAIVVEGYMDFIALYSKGIKNVIATLGTALTPNHLKTLERYTKNVVLLFDGDQAGREAADRSLPIMLQQDYIPKSVFLPDDLDPDEYLKEHSVESFLDLIKNSSELFSQTLDAWMVGYKGSTGEKLQLVNQFKTIVESAQSKALRSLMIKEFAERLGEEGRWVERNLMDSPKAPVPMSVLREEPRNDAFIEITGQFSLKGSPIEEIYLLQLSVKYLEFLEKVISSGVIEGFRGESTKTLLNMVIQRYRQSPESFASMASLILTRVKDTENFTRQFANFTGTEPQKEETKLFEASLKRVLDGHLRLRMLALTSEIKNGPSELKNSEKLEQIVNIQKNRRELNQ